VTWSQKAIRSRSLQKAPVTSSAPSTAGGGRVASHTGVSAPWAAVLGPPQLLMSVAHQPGLMQGGTSGVRRTQVRGGGAQGARMGGERGINRSIQKQHKLQTFMISFLALV
jgi:hypothetical protein